MTFKRAASTICALAMVAGMIGAQNVIGSASDNGTERDDLIPTSSQPGSSSSQGGGGSSSSSQGGG
ncbi:MAG: hypothetical protein IJ723_01095, partial [Ruminococcus sp.]|nr:hypothetical protein [Ruminococcus sp.]